MGEADLIPVYEVKLAALNEQTNDYEFFSTVMLLSTIPHLNSAIIIQVTTKMPLFLSRLNAWITVSHARVKKMLDFLMLLVDCDQSEIVFSDKACILDIAKRIVECPADPTVLHTTLELLNKLYDNDKHAETFIEKGLPQSLLQLSISRPDEALPISSIILKTVHASQAWSALFTTHPQFLSKVCSYVDLLSFIPQGAKIAANYIQFISDSCEVLGLHNLRISPQFITCIQAFAASHVSTHVKAHVSKLVADYSMRFDDVSNHVKDVIKGSAERAQEEVRKLAEEVRDCLDHAHAPITQLNEKAQKVMEKGVEITEGAYKVLKHVPGLESTANEVSKLHGVLTKSKATLHLKLWDAEKIGKEVESLGSPISKLSAELLDSVAKVDMLKDQMQHTIQDHAYHAIDALLHRPKLLNGVLPFVANTPNGPKLLANFTLGTGNAMLHLMKTFPHFDGVFNSASQIMARLGEGAEMIAQIPRYLGNLEDMGKMLVEKALQTTSLKVGVGRILHSFSTQVLGLDLPGISSFLEDSLKKITVGLLDIKKMNMANVFKHFFELGFGMNLNVLTTLMKDIALKVALSACPTGAAAVVKLELDQNIWRVLRTVAE